MGTLTKVLIGFVGILIALVVLSVFLPATAHVERSIVVKASPNEIFPYVNNLKAFNRWSPWFERDPDAQYEFTGPSNGVGMKMKWQSESDRVGSGSQEIVESRAPDFVATRLDFGQQGAANAEWRLEPSNGSTLVVWGFDSELGSNPMSRYFGLMMDSFIGADYEQGLENLKTLVESEISAN